MAFSKTNAKVSVFGNQRVEQFILAADANSGAVATALSVIDSVSTAVKSAATGSQKFKANLSDAQAASNGSLFASSCTNGDEFYVTVYGR